jgi:hypothetical protein
MLILPRTYGTPSKDFEAEFSVAQVPSAKENVLKALIYPLFWTANYSWGRYSIRGKMLSYFKWSGPRESRILKRDNWLM